MVTPSKVQIITCLEVIGGRFAKIQSSRAKGAVLTVEHRQIDEQDSLATVNLIPSREDKNVHVAICLKMNNKIYYPVVERDTITKKVSMRLETKTEPLDEFPETSLFKWDSNGQFGSLCSVEEPSQYLSVKDSIVILSSHRDQSFRIKLNNVESKAFGGRISVPESCQIPKCKNERKEKNLKEFIICKICKRLKYTVMMEDDKIPLLPPCMYRYRGLKGSTKDVFCKWQKAKYCNTFWWKCCTIVMIIIIIIIMVIM